MHRCNRSTLFLTTVVFLLMIGMVSCTSPVMPLAMDKVIEQESQLHIQEIYHALPLAFEANQGQADSSVKFLTRGNGYHLSLTESEAVFTLADGHGSSVPTTLRMQLVGANPSPQIEGIDAFAGKINYIIGDDPTQWHTQIPTYAKVRYQDVLSGIDMVYYGKGNQLEYDFVLAPGADPAQIQLQFQGAEGLEINEQGNLLLHTANGHLVQQAPIIYQEINDWQQTISGRYTLLDDQTIGFQIDDYDTTIPLIIDPVVDYVTFLGSSDTDNGRAIAIDDAGNIYVAGSSNATWGSPVQTHAGGTSDGFVAKLDGSGNLQWMTFAGSSAFDEILAIAVDNSGNVYVTGQSFASWGSPVTAYTNSPSDSFAAKLNGNSGTLIWNTFLGSTGNDWGQAIAVDNSGDVYIGGTSNVTWGTPINPYTGTTGNKQAYVAKLNTNGVRQWHTFMGSATGHTISRTIALDSTNHLYVGGQSVNTWGTPVTAHSGGIEDAFIAKLNSSGIRQWHTFVGGNDDDLIYSLVVDSLNNVIASGFSKASWGSPIDAFSSGIDAFVAKLSSSGTPQWHTYMGASGDHRSHAVTVDTNDSILVAGFSTSSWGNPDNPYAGGATDAFVAMLDANGARQWNTFLGGTSDDRGHGLVVDDDSNLYLVGRSSAAWGSPINAFSGGDDAFVVKLNPSPPLDFNDCQLSSYGGVQDASPTVNILDNGYTLHIQGNSWKKCLFPYTVTPYTVLEFDFRSGIEGEIHAIGFDTDSLLSPERSFKLYGVQTWGNPDFDNYVGPDWQHYEIPVGHFLTGDMSYLVFTNDHDLGSQNAESYFANVRVYEGNITPLAPPAPAPDPSNPPPLNFANCSISSYAGLQDAASTSSILDDNRTLIIQGNGWKKCTFPYTVTSNTILELDFFSTKQGEIHAIGFDTDEILSPERAFKLYGIQNWANPDFANYAGNGWQHYEIPVGQFFTGNMQHFVLVNDLDIGLPVANSLFANVTVYEGSGAQASSIMAEVPIHTVLDSSVNRTQEGIREELEEEDLPDDSILESSKGNWIGEEGLFIENTIFLPLIQGE